MRPSSLAEVVRRAKRDGAWRHHLDEFLDAFYDRHGDRSFQAKALCDDPGLLGRERADAFLGGAAEHLSRRWGLPIPGWVRAGSRFLDAAMFEPDEKRLRPVLIMASPVSFRARLIFTGPDPLQRARFPYHDGVLRLPSKDTAA